MNDALLEAFRHNSWATRRLLAFCRELSEEQLRSSATGTFGDILTTFNHFIRSEAAYLRRLSGSGPDWLEGGQSTDLGQLDSWVEETAERWEQFLAEPVDADQVFIVDDGANGVRAGVIVAQALHHGNHHREQICAILTSLGFQPPDIQAWEYGWETGRLWERTAGDPNAQ